MDAKRQFVKNLATGDDVDDLFSVKYKKPPRRYAKGFAFEARVADRTGEVTMKYWGSPDEAAVRSLYDSIKVGEVVRIKGQALTYKDAMEISVGVGGSVVPVATSCCCLGDFVATTEKDIEGMMASLMRHLAGVESAHLRSLLDSFFCDADFVSRFKSSPASIMIHANWIGGLLEHTLNVVSICDFIAQRYPGLDRDLVMAGAALHDIGKTLEYRVTTNIDESADGMLRGHIVAGADMVARACETIQDFPENLKLKLIHVIISHHGKPELGSPKRPQFPEAAAVSLADDMDCQIEQYVRTRAEAQTDDPWVYSKRLGPIFLG